MIISKTETKGVEKSNEVLVKDIVKEVVQEVIQEVEGDEGGEEVRTG